MKTLLTIVCSLTLISTFGTVRRVNNNVGVVAVPGLVYATIDAAFADAVNGDTLYLEPSSNSYSLTSGNINKRLVWIGNGYQIGQNNGLISTLPYSPLESIFTGQKTLQTAAAQSIFYGIAFTNNVNVTAGASEVQFHRCSFTEDLELLSSNNLVNQCFFGFTGSIFGSGINNTIKNSIICEMIMSQVSAIIDNCFVNSIGFGNSSMPENCTFTNSIILKAPSSVPLTNTFSHCMKIVNQSNLDPTFPVGGINNNIENVPVEEVFIIANPFSSTRKDRDFRLSPTSPAKGTGVTGIDMGAFGGSSPYRLSGQAPIPIITNFFLSTTGSTASGLTGSITIQSNN